MATDVVMPKLGLTMERGSISAWLKQEGEPVAKGEPLLEVETDKVTMEVEAQVDGILRRILVGVGIEVDVATPIAIIAAADERLEPAPESPVAVAVTTDSPGAASGDATSAPVLIPGLGQRPHRASPKARKIAAEHGIDLTNVQGSGTGGRIVSADLSGYVATVMVPTEPSPEKSTLVSLTRAQQVAAQRLTTSYQQAPHIQLRMEVAAHWLQQFRGGFAAEGKRVSYNDLILKGVAVALRQHPRLNSHFVDGQLEQLARIDLGIATDTPSGLVVPVLRDAGAMSIDTISQQSRRLLDLARDGHLDLDDLSGGSFTVSNLGMFGISSFTAIINPPQVAILAVGAVEQRVVAVDAQGGMGVRPMLTLNLATDHRAIDGAMASRFLQHLRDALQSPSLLA